LFDPGVDITRFRLKGQGLLNGKSLADLFEGSKESGPCTEGS